MLAWLKRRARPQDATGSVDTLVAQADAARECGERSAALRLYADAHAAAPDRVYPVYWLATLLQEDRNLDEAWKLAERGLALEPAQVGLLARMASIASDRLDPQAALDLYRRVATIAPDFPDIDALLADQYCHLGQIDYGIAAFDRAIAQAPDSCTLEQSRLFCLNYSDRRSPQALADEHRAWGRKYGLPDARPSAARPPSDDRLHVGYVSPDLRNHAVAYFVAPLLAHHDRARVTVSVFDTSTQAEDAMTASMRPHVDHWHRVAELPDTELAELIRAQRVDVLFDLSGHTRGNRLRVFAHRPAPVQVSWLGYLATTGLPAIDFRLTDAVMDPPGMTEALHTEELVRIPVQACFSPLTESPDVGPPPSQSGEPLTFGSVNQWAKVSEATKGLWAGILADRPAARLFVVARGGQNPEVKERISREFAQRGARDGQVSVFPFGATTDFLRFLNRIDVALDPFPYGGGTTTMQCLWMGVPVVTLAGTTSMSRNSIGPLSRVGLADLVADSPASYRDIALRLGADAPRLASLRRDLRSAMAASPSMDADAFARSVEDACRSMLDARLASTRE